MTGHPLLSLPNQFTLLRIFLTPVFYFFFFDETLLGSLLCAFLFAVAALTDWYDGYLARRYNLITRWGKFLDPLADKILTLTAFYAFYKSGLMPGWMLVTIAGRDIFLTIYRLFQESKGYSIPANLIAKWKTASQLVMIILVLVAVLYPRLFPGDPVISPLLLMFQQSVTLEILFGLLTAYTVFSGIVYLIDDVAIRNPRRTS